MFSAVAFYGSQSVALKGEEMYLGFTDFLICVVFVLIEVRWHAHIQILCQIIADVMK